MKRYLLLYVVTIFLTSCSGHQNKTLPEIKANLDCVEYTEGITWMQITQNFGKPDAAPFPEPGLNLQSNSRIYEDVIVIITTKNSEIKTGDKVRFHEVVTGIELCKKK
jgi:hypothetical protein